MESFLEQFPPKKSGETDPEKVKELENLKDEILTTLNAFTRLVILRYIYPAGVVVSNLNC